MPLLTVRAVEAFRPKAEPYKVTLDRGLQLRIAPDGKRTLLVRYTVKGSNTERQYRLPQEYGDAPGQLKLAAACAEAGRIRTLARQGVDWTVAEDTRLEAEASARAAALQRRGGPTLEAELRDYVEKKRRVKDKLPLKARTKSDYLAAIEPPRVTKSGTRRAAGPLHPIAHKPLATLTASDIRATYETTARRSQRRAEYAMQILRAVLRWNGVVIPGNPLGSETAGRDRITITAAKGDPVPIPPELLGAWWRAAERASSQVASDYYRFQLLTGCRGVEIHGHKLHKYPPIRVGDVDQLQRGRSCAWEEMATNVQRFSFALPLRRPDDRGTAAAWLRYRRQWRGLLASGSGWTASAGRGRVKTGTELAWAKNRRVRTAQDRRSFPRQGSEDRRICCPRAFSHTLGHERPLTNVCCRASRHRSDLRLSTMPFLVPNVAPARGRSLRWHKRIVAPGRGGAATLILSGCCARSMSPGTPLLQ